MGFSRRVAETVHDEEVVYRWGDKGDRASGAAKEAAGKATGNESLPPRDGASRSRATSSRAARS
jgi:hypothetical protein